MTQRQGFIDKETDKESGLGDFGVRKYDEDNGRFVSIDPLWEKFRSLSPYVYSYNNPLLFQDRTGLKPGDIFVSPAQAAHDFGKNYNDNSIRQGQEYGSTIYIVKQNNQTFYTYTIPAKGGNDGVTPSAAPEGATVVADVHSHGKYEKGYNNNDFSTNDKIDNIKKLTDGYLTTPDGSLKKYDVQTGVETTITIDLPSDPNDPKRKNKISPEETNTGSGIPGVTTPHSNIER